MSTTAIEWTDKTWNPTTGCDRTSPGCDNCYALDLAARLKRMGQRKYQNDGDPRTSGPGFRLTIHPEDPDLIYRPLTWRKPCRVFVNSMSDLFHRDVPETFIGSVWDIMGLAERHTFQVLTKRPQRMAKILRGWEADDWTWRRHDLMWCGPIPGPLPNVWLGTSIESDAYTWRANHLRATPAAVRFLSLEPLLGPLPSLDLTGIDWVIAGGESQAGARPMHPDWVRDIRDRCVAAGVPFLFKQWGAWAPDGLTWSKFTEAEVGTVRGRRFLSPSITEPCPVEEANSALAITSTGNATRMKRMPVSKAGRELDGRTWDEYPAAAS